MLDAPLEHVVLAVKRCKSEPCLTFTGDRPLQRLDDLQLDGAAADDQARPTAHARAPAHGKEAQVRLVRPALRGEPIQGIIGSRSEPVQISCSD